MTFEIKIYHRFTHECGCHIKLKFTCLFQEYIVWRLKNLTCYGYQEKSKYELSVNTIKSYENGTCVKCKTIGRKTIEDENIIL